MSSVGLKEFAQYQYTCRHQVAINVGAMSGHQTALRWAILGDVGDGSGLQRHL